jgi:CRISPR-associated protein Cmr4
VFEKAGMLYLYVETPLHAGSGTSLGIVDLPIQRERTTGYPMVQASSLKGCLREASKGKDEQKIRIVFGPDTKEAHEHAGALSVGDAQILLFPVRSLLGVFAWVTSKDVLARFKRDARAAGLKVDWTPVGPSADDEALVAGNAIASDGKVVLEEFAFSAYPNEIAQKIARWISTNALPEGDEYKYWREALPQRLVILPEDTFRDFTLFSTEVISRTRLNDETKTVERGALWTEEHLPSDTLLYAPLFASKPRVEDKELPDDWKAADDKPGKILEFVKDCVDGKRIQLGGDSTVGRGFVAVRMSIPAAKGVNKDAQ